MNNENTTNFKVELFVLSGVILFFVVTYILGQERHFFEKPVFLKTRLENVSGLQVGANVQLNGVDIGIVSQIEFPQWQNSRDSQLLPPMLLTDLIRQFEKLQSAESKGKTAAKLVLTSQLTRNVLISPQKINIVFSCVMQASLQSKSGLNKFCGPAERKVSILLKGRDRFGDLLEEKLDMRWRYKGTRIESHAEFTQIDAVEVLQVENSEKKRAYKDVMRVYVAPAKSITVTMRIQEEALKRIREGSTVELSSMGLLGDKLLNIYLGDVDARPYQDGAMIPSRLTGMDQALARVPDIIEAFDGVKDSLREVNETVAHFGEAGGKEILTQALETIEKIALEVKDGQGLVHELIWNQSSADQYKQMIDDLQVAIQESKVILTNVRSGDGIIHGLVYEQGGGDIVQSTKKSLAEVAKLLEDIHKKEGLAHQLIYKEDNGEILTNLTDLSKDLKEASQQIKEMSADMKSMMKSIKNGEGTVGALIQDPSVYEDLKLLLGNMRRNEGTKALLRYGIKEADKKQ